MKKFDVIIVGGGLVGLTAAISLVNANNKLDIALIDKNIKQSNLDIQIDNKIYAISPHNVTYLKSLNVWSDLPDRIGSIHKMDVYGDIDSNILLDKNTTHSSYLAKTIEYKVLHYFLMNEISNHPNITIINDELTNFDINTKILHGKQNLYTAYLTIGSDGAQSIIRKSLNISPVIFDYKKAGVVANFYCENPHYNTAYQWFKDGNVLAYLPMPQNRISIVYSCDEYTDLTKLSPDDFSEYIAKLGDYKLGRLRLINPPEYFPLKLSLIDKVYNDGVVLIGDAAHTIHPLAGMGLNLGFSDVECLAKTLTGIQKKQYGDVAILSKYALDRQMEAQKMQYICHYLERLFASDNTTIRNLRNIGLNIVNHSKALKKFLINHAIE